MNRRLRVVLLCLISALSLPFASCFLIGATTFSVLSVTSYVDNSSFSGACPKTFTFTGIITAGGSGTVTYQWERSDGAIAPVQSVTFAAAGSQTVTDTWQLGASNSGWERVHVLTPNDITSTQANFTLTCATMVTSVTASVDSASYSGACPETFIFTGTISTNGPGTVTYQWERSDGVIAAVQSVVFAAAGSQTVTNTWQVGSSSSGWERVHVLTPNDISSTQANFTLNCVTMVTTVTISVDSASYSGACPKTLTFTGTIAANGPGTVTYQWERSDGTITPIQSVTFIAAGSQTITNTWQIGSSSSGWERVHVLTPNDISSNQAIFNLTCAAKVLTVTMSVDIPSIIGSCPQFFTFTGVITVSAPTTVTYQLERSDGEISSVQTMTFPSAGFQTITDIWALGATYSGWERIHVLTPNDITSSNANFSLNCGLSVTNIVVTVNPSSFTGVCPKIINFTATITVDGPGTVTYRWERSDGALAPVQTITFLTAGSQTVTETWQLGGTYNGWERIHILTPDNLASPEADFNLTCIVI